MDLIPSTGFLRDAGYAPHRSEQDPACHPSSRSESSCIANDERPGRILRAPLSPSSARVDAPPPEACVAGTAAEGRWEELNKTAPLLTRGPALLAARLLEPGVP